MTNLIELLIPAMHLSFTPEFKISDPLITTTGNLIVHSEPHKWRFFDIGGSIRRL